MGQVLSKVLIRITHFILSTVLGDKYTQYFADEVPGKSHIQYKWLWQDLNSAALMSDHRLLNYLFYWVLCHLCLGNSPPATLETLKLFEENELGIRPMTEKD
jgi:hypothetical protein